MLRITKDFIKVHEFVSDGLIFLEDDEEKVFRLRPGMCLPPSVEEQNLELRKKLAIVFSTEYRNYAQLEVRCGISESLMRKYLKGTRNITREAIAKICVGTPLSIEQSEELFTLQGHSLEPLTQRFDAVVVNAIQDGDDIGTFFDTCEELGIKIF